MQHQQLVYQGPAATTLRVETIYGTMTRERSIAQLSFVACKIRYFEERFRGRESNLRWKQLGEGSRRQEQRRNVFCRHHGAGDDLDST